MVGDEIMSYRRSWSRTFFTDEFRLTTAWPHPEPKVSHEYLDPVTGRPLAFRAAYFAPNTTVWGSWYLNDPINLGYVMPGINRKILRVASQGLYEGSYGVGGGIQNSFIRLFADDGEIFMSPKLRHGNNVWVINEFIVNQNVDQFSNLNFNVKQEVQANAPSTTVVENDGYFIIEGEYYTETPPARATVMINVFDRDNQTNISGADVSIMNGPIVIAKDFTNGGGVIFNNIDEGSYSLKVRKSGYEPYEQSIQVISPEVIYDVSLSLM